MLHNTSPWQRLASPWQRWEWPAACAPLAGLAATPVVLALLNRQTTTDAAVLTWISGIAMSVALVTAAVLASLARTVVTRDLWPVVTVLSAMAAHSVTATTLGLVSDADAGPPPAWAMTVNLLVLVGAVALVRLFPARGFRPPPVALGATLGLAVATTLVAPPGLLPAGTGLAGGVLAVAVLLGYGLATSVIRRHWPWSAESRTYATVALMALGCAQAVQGLVPTADWLGPARAGAELVAAGLLGSTMYAIVNRDLVTHRRRTSALLEQLLEDEEAERRERADRHAIRNMVAGISMASELLEDDLLDEPMRRRLEHTIHLEAEQLRCLLDQNQRTPSVRKAGHPEASTTALHHETGRRSDPTILPVLRVVGE